MSTEDLQDPASSRQWQLARAGDLVEKAGGEIVAEFFDVGQSRAVAWPQRLEGGRLLAALEDPRRGFEAVVVGEPQRVFYDNQYALTFPLFVHFGVQLWVPEIGGAVDPDSEAHNLIMSMYAGMSKAERRRIQLRVRTAMAAQAELEGRFLGGRPPYGYRLVDAGPHPRPDLAALGARLHRLDLDSETAPVVRRIFALRLAGYGARRIVNKLNSEGVLCPSAYDRARNRHRSADGWSVGTVLAILANPRYTGHQVWNKQSKAETLLDVRNVGLGTRTVSRWNPGEKWVYSREAVHPAIVSTADFRRAQTTPATRGPQRTYLLRGLLRCGLCGRGLEGAWNNGRANYRCQAVRAAEHVVADKRRNVFVREDTVLARLGGLLIRALTPPGDRFEEITIPRDLPEQADLCRELALTLIYDPVAQTLRADRGDNERIIAYLR
ncbi:recombinase family protein [Allonocardiopsis opalescens]|uniref:recombinase family protein n=1 Tax=Allonocardiopsis opalescens TaxID=1144618 RepID=UPI001B806340|nr:recombinase family protein [Allonocardiopsis opalescens]